MTPFERRRLDRRPRRSRRHEGPHPRRARPKPQRPVEPAQPPPGWERRSKQAHLQRLAREQIQARETDEALATLERGWDSINNGYVTSLTGALDNRAVLRIYGPTATTFNFG